MKFSTKKMNHRVHSSAKHSSAEHSSKSMRGRGGNRMTPISFRTGVSGTLCPLQAGSQSRQRRVGTRHWVGRYGGMYKNTPPAVIKAVLSIQNKKSNYCFWYFTSTNSRIILKEKKQITGSGITNSRVSKIWEK